jgi:hypothetical protein
MEPEQLDINIGLLEMLRLDRWIDESTSEVTFGGVMWNADVQILSSWELRWELTAGGLIGLPAITIHSAPIQMTSFGERSAWQSTLLFLCLLYQLFLIASQVLELVNDEREHADGNAEHRRNWFQWTYALLYMSVHMFYIAYQAELFLFSWDYDSGFAILDDRRIQGAVQGHQIAEAARDTHRITDWLARWDTYRNYHGVLCVVCSMELFFSASHWSPEVSVLSQTIHTAKKQLQAFCFSIALALLIWVTAAHLTFGRRFWHFRTFWTSVAGFVGPTVGGNSHMEDAGLANKGITSEWILAFVVYLTYIGFIILLLFNILLAILVDGYEEAKDKQEKKSSFFSAKSANIHRVQDLMESFFTLKIHVAASAAAETFVPVEPKYKVHSVAAEPCQECRKVGVSCHHRGIAQTENGPVAVEIQVLPVSAGQVIYIRRASGCVDALNLHAVVSSRTKHIGLIGLASLDENHFGLRQVFCGTHHKFDKSDLGTSQNLDTDMENLGRKTFLKRCTRYVIYRRAYVATQVLKFSRHVRDATCSRKRNLSSQVAASGEVFRAPPCILPPWLSIETLQGGARAASPRRGGSQEKWSRRPTELLTLKCTEYVRRQLHDKLRLAEEGNCGFKLRETRKLQKWLRHGRLSKIATHSNSHVVAIDLKLKRAKGATAAADGRSHMASLDGIELLGGVERPASGSQPQRTLRLISESEFMHAETAASMSDAVLLPRDAAQTVDLAVGRAVIPLTPFSITHLYGASLDRGRKWRRKMTVWPSSRSTISMSSSPRLCSASRRRSSRSRRS